MKDSGFHAFYNDSSNLKMVTQFESPSHSDSSQFNSLLLQLEAFNGAIYAFQWEFVRTLEWSEGYYDGDIKTRKTVQAFELNSDPLGLQRSDQLRELFESLSLGETSPQPKSPTAALSPEDLTNTEWYFLVCMSFVFNVGQGLPGRSFAKNDTIWLRNAHLADTKLFSRSLLAKVPEDRNLIQHIKTSFLENSSDIVTNPNHGHVYQVLEHAESNLDEVVVCLRCP